MVRKISIFISIAVLSTLGAIGVRSWHRGQSVLAQQKHAADLIASLPPIVPMKVTFQEILRVTGKPDLLSTERDYAVKSDGSTCEVNKQHNNAGDVYLTHWRIVLADGTNAEGDNVTNSMTAVKLPASPIHAAMERWDPNSGCSARADGLGQVAGPSGHETILGIDTVKFLSSDSRTARITVWRAPALNCVELRRLAEFKNADGSIRDTSELIATAVVPGDPEESLFHLPGNLENVSYSERHRRMVAAAGRTLDAAELKAVQRQDALFDKYRIGH